MNEFAKNIKDNAMEKSQIKEIEDMLVKLSEGWGALDKKMTEQVETMKVIGQEMGHEKAKPIIDGLMQRRLQLADCRVELCDVRSFAT